MNTTEQGGFRIPAPPDRPRYHEYAAGAPGDYRPQSERFADRVIRERGLEASPEIRAALAQAFDAGAAWQSEVS